MEELAVEEAPEEQKEKVFVLELENYTEYIVVPYNNNIIVENLINYDNDVCPPWVNLVYEAYESNKISTYPKNMKDKFIDFRSKYICPPKNIIKSNRLHYRKDDLDATRVLIIVIENKYFVLFKEDNSDFFWGVHFNSNSPEFRELS